MLFELLLLTAWLIGSVLFITASFYVGRFIARKIEDFFDRRL